MGVEEKVSGFYLIELRSFVYKFKWSIEIKFRFIIFHLISIYKYYRILFIVSDKNTLSYEQIIIHILILFIILFVMIFISCNSL